MSPPNEDGPMTGGSPPPVLRGRITDGSGAPVESATVFFGAGSPPHQEIAQVTGRDGVFFYPTLLAGNYKLVITSPAGSTVNLDVMVDPAVPKDLDIIMPDCTHTGDGGGD